MEKRISRRLTLPVLAIVLFCVPLAAVAQSDPSVYERGDRDGRQKPDCVMNIIGLKAGMTIADIGAGGGYFTVRFARRVGDGGAVFANDINAAYLDYIRKRLQREKITNTTVILGAEKDPNLPDQSCDIAFMSNVYHHLTDARAMLENIRKDLKPGGTLVILETDASKRRTAHSSDPLKVSEEAKAAGYGIVALNREQPSFYILILKPR